MEPFRRKTPEEILESIYELKRGRLKVYIGPVSGSGKTYQMLREGQALQKQGVDVVLCAVSTNQRLDTIDQLAKLERIPSLHWSRKGVEVKDLDLSAIVRRNPEVLLSDGLAHRNRPGAEHPGRLEDIKYLLDQGISVITTINVFELEGAADLARELTGIHTDYLLPAEALSLADEVCLVDVTPEKILERFNRGRMGRQQSYPPLSKEKLGKLREIALRLVAEEVDGSLQKHREAEGVKGQAGIAEKVLVAAQYYWNGSIHIRRGQQIAKRLNAELLICSFWKRGVKPSREAAAFKRAIWKLAGKLGTPIREISVRSRREIAVQLAKVAGDTQVTRIVMGHSKQTLWQDIWKGSIVKALLRHIRYTDVFLIADRSEAEGERLLPTRKAGPVRERGSFNRLSREELHHKIEGIRRGTFKVYIGCAPGVGKTYKMLREGNELLGEGIDVVVGLLETHGRQETLEQVGSLALIPKRSLDYRGRRLEEMDISAIIQRNPEVVLVDELAHTNMPGSRNSKRYMDIMELLEAGISVISTMNVQHLESLNDAVEQITGIRVRETVPDRILHIADEVELIDLTPHALRQRMKEGKIYASSKVEQALSNFFRMGNLIALRELALRELADDVDERLEAWERDGSLRGPWRRREVIYVCVTLSPEAERLIRRGFRIAYRLKAVWYVTYVMEKRRMETAAGQRLEELRALTERLGGCFKCIEKKRGQRIPAILLERANKLGSTQIILGQSGASWLRNLLRGNVTAEMLRRARHMDILIASSSGGAVSNKKGS
ncbi:histidine kinase [Paenibacillus sp. CAA11]|uniref:universal stress protein n=1 Tax=Paenibacillus sp. CAA11 TaxID=1532905 RepID=UPI000D3A4A73|nr:universal stress protein [Paenibacillus sp. CAA11]AWB43295.1 histidine kinase [Paenibacillus sp. CAA11]